MISTAMEVGNKPAEIPQNMQPITYKPALHPENLPGNAEQNLTCWPAFGRVPLVPSSHAVTIWFVVPNSQMGSVIGKAGSKIKEIQDMSTSTKAQKSGGSKTKEMGRIIKKQALKLEEERHWLTSKLKEEECRRFAKQLDKTAEIETGAILKDVYNAKTKLLRTPIKHIYYELISSKYLYDFKKDRNNTINHLFFEHPESIRLAQIYHHFTNVFRYPHIYIVRMTATNQVFSIAFCFQRAEKEEYYLWSLKKLNKIWAALAIPKTFVTEIELALTKAMEKVLLSGLFTGHRGMNEEAQKN
ncbi:hypothetical protein BY996DRAFT_6623255 [Phakopsora pachyrhizi]|nr:hypothetical protein BY996DRAFT_6623255 [Phakopsora pachyrhizi]